MVKKYPSKPTILRATAAAISLSISFGSRGSGNKKVLDEAQAIWEMGKTLGLEFVGSDEQVVRKIVELEVSRPEIQQWD